MAQLTELRLELDAHRAHTYVALDINMFNTVLFHAHKMVKIQEQINRLPPSELPKGE